MMAGDLDGLKPEDLVEETGSSPDPLIGRVLQGRYEVCALVARGGMGKIYRAEQVPLGRPVALKVLDLGYSTEFDPEFRKRFFLEAATSARLAHPNTIRIFDYGHEGDVFFIAMEFIEGRTLLKIIKDEAPLPPLRVVHLARQMCGSLQEAHGLGVIHRDLKPSNVLVTRHGDLVDYVKVLDFGLVKLLEDDGQEMTKSGLFLGSPNYMSPEQIRAKGVDQRSDIYSLGVILYRALTGRIPFRRDSSMGTLVAQLEDDPPPFSRSAPGVPIPESLETLVMRCLHKTPDGRFNTVQDLDQALSAAAHGIRNGPPIQEPSLVPGRRRPAADPRDAETAEMPAAPPPSEAPPRRRKPRGRDAKAPARTTGGSRNLPWGIGAAALLALLCVLFAVIVAKTRSSPQADEAPVESPAVVYATIVSAPTGAVVFRGEDFLGSTPLELAVPAGEEWNIDVQKAGHMPEAVIVRAGESRRVDLLAVGSEAADSTPETTSPPRASRAPRAAPPTRARAETREETPEATPRPRRGSDLRDPWGDE